MQILSRLLRASFDTPISPDQPFVAIGDVHGRMDLLTRLLDDCPAGFRRIFVGDYVDRGPQSAEVLHLVHHLAATEDTVCLLGNHERMLLDFLDAPERCGSRWLTFGGLQTLESFGIAVSRPKPDKHELIALAQTLKDALSPTVLAWLRACPLSWQSGNVAVVHAAADPRAPIAHQVEDTLLWGHADFRRKHRNDGVWVLHGHTIVDVAKARNGVVSIDTGAYATNRLTAAIVTRGDVEFLTT